MNLPCTLQIGLFAILAAFLQGPAELFESPDGVPGQARTAWDQFAHDFEITRLDLVAETRNSAAAEFRLSHATVKCYQNKYLMVWDNLVKGVNERYGFELRRSASDKPWALTVLVLKKEGDELSEFDRWVARQKELTHLTALAVGPTTLNRLAQHHGFSAIQVQPPGDNPNLVCIDFEIQDHTALIDGYPIAIKRGRLTLDPTKSWLPVRRELVWPTGVTLIHELLRFTKGNGIEYPIEMHGTSLEPDGSTWLFNKTTFEEVQIGGSVPDKEFTLSYFGLPEPFESPQRFPPYFWIAAAAVFMIAMGMLLRARARTRNA